MHETPCETLVKCREETGDRLTNIENDVRSIQDDVKAMREIIETWNNTKGFVTTIHNLSKVTVWLTTTSAALAGIWYAIKHFKL